MASKTAVVLSDLSPRQRKWVELVLDGKSDVRAYREAYNCTQAAAVKNAHRMRKNEGVLRVLMRARAHVEQFWLEALAPATRKGRLCRIMLEGSDGDTIRAIRELNAMEDRERAQGVGGETEFSKLLMMIARRPRVLPYQDEDDKMFIEAEGLP